MWISGVGRRMRRDSRGNGAQFTATEAERAMLESAGASLSKEQFRRSSGNRTKAGC